MNHGLNGTSLFNNPAHYQAFLSTLADTQQRFGLEVHAYCLMAQHYHLLVHTPDGNLSRAMRHINGVYTQWFNRQAAREGPLFRGRYKAIVVDTDNYLLSVSRYIHRNPLTAQSSPVSSLAEYPWSSYPAYVNLTAAPAWLHRQPILAAMASTADPVSAYREYVGQGVEPGLSNFYQAARQSPLLGSATFRSHILAKVRNGGADEVAAWESQTRSPPSLTQIVQAAAHVCHLSPEDLTRRPGRGRTAWLPERAMAMYLCQEQGRLPLKAIAAEFGDLHYSAVSQAIRRFKQQLADGTLEHTIVDLVLERLELPPGEEITLGVLEY
ncbi:MAG: transposase [Natronospirillum sp.]